MFYRGIVLMSIRSVGENKKKGFAAGTQPVTGFVFGLFRGGKYQVLLTDLLASDFLFLFPIS